MIFHGGVCSSAGVVTSKRIDITNRYDREEKNASLGSQLGEPLPDKFFGFNMNRENARC